MLEAAQEDRRSTDARALLDSVEANLRQQSSVPVKACLCISAPACSSHPALRRVARALPSHPGTLEAAKRGSGAGLSLFLYT